MIRWDLSVCAVVTTHHGVQVHSDTLYVISHKDQLYIRTLFAGVSLYTVALNNIFTMVTR